MPAARPVVGRVYDAIVPGEHRALVDRLWPRGLARADAALDEWVTAVAPSTALRRWCGHEPSRFEEFARRYRAELERPPAAAEVERLARIAAARPLRLLTATRDVERSGAAVLAEHLAAQPT